MKWSTSNNNRTEFNLTFLEELVKLEAAAAAATDTDVSEGDGRMDGSKRGWFEIRN